MLKKSWLIGLAVVMIAVIIGCSGNNDKTANTPGTNQPSASQPQSSNDSGTDGQYKEGDYTLPIVQEPLEIVWMGRDSEQAGMSFLTNKTIVWEEAKKATGISIKWDVVPNAEYAQIMQMRLGSGKDLPDVISIVGTADGSHLVKYAEEGVLLPLNDLIDKYAPNLKKMLEDHPEYKKAITLPNGDIVALGNLTASKLYTRDPSIRKDWLDKLQLGEVHTPDELMNAIRAFVNNDPNGNGQKDEFGIMGGGLHDYKQLGSMFGMSLVSGSGWSVRDGKVTYEYILPEYKQFLEWMHQAYSEGLIPKDFQTADGNVMTERVSTDRLGFRARNLITSFAEWNNPENTVQKNTPGAVWMPINFTNPEAVYPMDPIALVWRTYGITKNAKDPVAIIRLLDYIMAGEGKLDMIYGIEGKTYNMVNDKPVYVDNLTEVLGPDTFMGQDYAPAIVTDQRMASVFELPYLNSDASLKEWSIKSAQEIAAKAHVPFQPPIPTAEDALKISNLYSDLDTYRDEMFVKFITGEAKLSDYDKYVQEMKSIGADQIAELYQQGYDRLK